MTDDLRVTLPGTHLADVVCAAHPNPYQAAPTLYRTACNGGFRATDNPIWHPADEPVTCPACKRALAKEARPVSQATSVAGAQGN
ncbi:hypothetical protein [Streptomyces sp. NPDC088752]|uniref:hypothetical protein n=1 Tax=Streptomyces sp. NPDC088752 TaxID=3154963 RepID=UPI00343F83AF